MFKDIKGGEEKNNDDSLSPRMVKLAARNKVKCILGDITQALPFGDASFDLVCAAYVAHGLRPRERYEMYAEAARQSRESVLLCDYPQGLKNKSVAASDDTRLWGIAKGHLFRGDLHKDSML